MSVTYRDYGAALGKSNQDLRVTIKGPGAKNTLLVTASYARTGRGAFSTLNPSSFYGRLIVLAGEVPIFTELDSNSDLQNIYGPNVLFDADMTSMGPFVFIPPLTDLEGNVRTSQGGSVSIVLCRAFTDNILDLFIPKLNVSGQTNFGKVA
jgi:hypothetical protein